MAKNPTFITFFPITFLLFAVSSATTIPLGSTLFPNSSSPWSSPNKSFSLSFIPSPSSPSLFLAAITYYGGIPVWYLSAAVVSSSASSLTSSGNIVLTKGSSSSVPIVWQSSTSKANVSSTSLDESSK